MERTAETALEILHDMANEVRNKDTSNALHAVANTLEKEIHRLEQLTELRDAITGLQVEALQLIVDARR